MSCKGCITALFIPFASRNKNQKSNKSLPKTYTGYILIKKVIPPLGETLKWRESFDPVCHSETMKEVREESRMLKADVILNKFGVG